MTVIQCCSIGSWFGLVLCTVSSFASPFELSLEPTTAITARLIGNANVIVGVQGGAEGTSFKSDFLFALEDTSDRVILEYDLKCLSVVQSAVIALGARPFNRPGDSKTLELFAFRGNGLANAADYFRLDEFITTFEGPGVLPNTEPLFWSLDITTTFNRSIRENYDFLGLLIRSGVGARYDFLSNPKLHLFVPEPSMPTIAIPAALLFLVGRWGPRIRVRG